MISTGSRALKASLVVLALGASSVSGCASGGRNEPAVAATAREIGEQNKRVIRDMVRVVWTDRNLAGLKMYWSDDCVNHADQPPNNTGQVPLLAYHQGFLTGFLPAFSDQRIEFVQQIAEGDLVVSQMRFHGRQTGEVFGV